MIKQANSSIEQQQQLFWEFCKNKAAIRLMFYKFYVDKANYTYDIEDFQVKADEEARNKLLEKQKQLKEQGKQLEIGDVDLSVPAKKTRVESISKDDIYGVNFDINIEVSQGLADSKLSEAQMWDTLIVNGGIQNLDPEMLELYLEANPVVSARTKQVLRSIVEKQKKSENTQLKAALKQTTMKLTEAAEIIKRLQGQYDELKSFDANLTKEFTGKIDAQNKTIEGQNKYISDLLAQLNQTEGSVKSDNARGVGGGNIPN